jgi:hypothetical protein
MVVRSARVASVAIVLSALSYDRSMPRAASPSPAVTPVKVWGPRVEATATRDVVGAAIPDIDQIPWQSGPSIGDGVSFKDTGNPRGASAFIAYAGYEVSSSAARSWATALYRAALAERGVRYVWAVQGPAHPMYRNQEIGTGRIARTLVADVAPEARFVLVAAHSSGSYVAHELFTRLARGLDPDGATAAKIVYFDLDGAAFGLSPAVVGRLRRAYFTSSYDLTYGTPSPNAELMRLAASTLPGARFVKNVTLDSDCNPGATWCVHMTLITTQPHDRTRSSPRDYEEVTDRSVARTWLEEAARDAEL